MVISRSPDIVTFQLEEMIEGKDYKMWLIHQSQETQGTFH